VTEPAAAAETADWRRGLAIAVAGRIPNVFLIQACSLHHTKQQVAQKRLGTLSWRSLLLTDAEK